MESHLFLAVRRNPAARAHPVLSALLYTFCPAACRWWLGGVDPAPLFDPYWAALEYRAAGRTLREVLSEWELDALLPFARRYVHRVEAYRKQAQNRRVQSPEQLPTFMEGVLPLAERHRSAGPLARIGGWQNFYPFLRAWAFVLPDWLEQLRVDADPGIELIDVPVRCREAPGLHLPAWQFDEKGRKTVAFLASKTNTSASFQAALIARLSVLEPGTGLSMLDSDGRVHAFRPSWPPEKLAETLHRLAGLAVDGPHPPLAGLKDPLVCDRCGFAAICRGESAARDGAFSDLALHF